MLRPGYTAGVTSAIDEALPGADLVRTGLDDVRHGRESVEALLVLVGAPRLRRIGIDVPERALEHPEHRLYELLARRMRALVDAERLGAFMRQLGAAARRPGRVYQTGGTTAVLEGWRASTIDVDLKMVPEQDEVFRAIPRLQATVERWSG
jgi:hypothetical protein